MKGCAIRKLLLVFALGSFAAGQTKSVFTHYSPTGDGHDAVRLYSPLNHRGDLSRASFGFACQCVGTHLGPDLFYGLIARGGDQDWFSVGPRNTRTVIRDLGLFGWQNTFKVPVVPPLLKNTSSAGDSAASAKTLRSGAFAKAVVGHLYVVHVKKSGSDFYALFRVESIESGDNCTISWLRLSDEELARQADLHSKIGLCQRQVDRLPPTCRSGDVVTEQSGGVVNIEIKLGCGESFDCTWACVQGEKGGPSFDVKHGPWSLCKLCFPKEPLPGDCYASSR